MPNVTFIADDGTETVLDVAVGTSIMEAAVMSNVDGIMGECGGSINCATCHVYVQNAGGFGLPDVGEVENEMLDATAAERRPESRLSCQLIMTEAMAGLIVRLPDAQY
ncbi:2Fe-2S iron-sulfur cluster-binding protein [Alloyangia pacifica]|uniref:Ferredoxin, 2Fe-2S n=1 Tax=Alloyangia pacifica TaxID=311180 RepID=A0A1I6WH05_9RHOB|nr:2Fe-2S iron-sulfur cluster-binding protein [Alloyangia pacifica]SDI71963.1 ferredoxin, 2Fe-2S [Alloyangia pacifica]SFT24854.1 ferredoxin, 2Fe-2S [Alloyangia pacifica]